MQSFAKLYSKTFDKESVFILIQVLLGKGNYYLVSIAVKLTDFNRGKEKCTMFAHLWTAEYIFLHGK